MEGKIKKQHENKGLEGPGSEICIQVGLKNFKYMKIQFDHQTFSLQQYGGISRYFSALQNYIQNRDGLTMGRGILVSRNHYLSRAIYPIPSPLGRALVSKSRTYA